MIVFIGNVTCMFFIFQLDPSKGNVAFGSGLYGWGFSLPQFASFYSSKMGLDENKMLKRLWGNHFYNAEVRKWSKTPQPGYVRGFVKFVLQPIYKVKKKKNITMHTCLIFKIFIKKILKVCL